MLQSCAVEYRESFINVDAGERLRMRVSQLAPPVRGELILTHGLGEHCRRYEHVVSAFAAHGVRVWTYDLRGHGRSDGIRGDIVSYDYFLSDLDLILSLVRSEGAPGAPIFLFGHSFGGQVTCRFLEEKQPEIAGAIIASPWLRLAFKPAWWRILFARMGMLVCPSHPHPTPTSLDRLSRDMEHLLKMPELELTHRRMSPRMYFAIEKQGAAALRNGRLIQTSILLLHGEADSITSYRATEELFKVIGSKDKQLKLYEGAFHETHNDLCRNRVIEDMCTWLDQHLPAVA